MPTESARRDVRPGSATWWAQREPSVVRSTMSAERITEVALTVIDRDGLEEMSMRGLAREMNTGTAQLYRYVSGKDEVLTLVMDHVIGLVRPDVSSAAQWPEIISAVAVALRQTLLEHPNVVALLATTPAIGPHALAGRELILEVLLQSGFSPQRAAHTYLTIVNFVIGFALLEVNDTPVPGHEMAVREYYLSLPSALYGAIVSLADELTGPSLVVPFEFGLHLLLTGLANAQDSVQSGPPHSKGKKP